MACKIYDTKAGKYLTKSKVKIEEGFFDSPGFLDSFGDWINDEVPYLTDQDGKITPESRVLQDGSPRIYYNSKKTQAFYFDKTNNKVPILNVEFQSIPAETRWEVAYAVNDALLYGVSQELRLEKGPYSQLTSDKLLGDLYDELADSYKEYELEEVIIRTLEKDKDDHIDLLKQRLYTMGIKYREVDSQDEVLEDEAVEDPKNRHDVVQKPSYERRPSDTIGADIKFLLEFSPITDSNGNVITSNYIPSVPLFMDPSKSFGILLDTITGIPQELIDSTYYTSAVYGKAKNAIDTMMSRLKKVASRYPWMNDLVVILDNSNEEFKLQFLQAFALQKNYINTVEVTRQGRYTTKDTTNSNKESRYVLNDWISAVTEKFYSGENKSEDVVKAYKEVLKDSKGQLEAIKKNNPWEKEVEELKLEGWNAVKSLVNFLNISVDFEVFSKYIDTALNAQELQSTTAINKKAVASIEGIIINLDNISNQSSLSEVKTFASNNLRPLAEAYVEQYSSLSDWMATVGNKRIYLYSQPTVIQMQVAEWKADPTILETIIQDVPSVRNSKWINNFIENPASLQNFRVSLRGQVQNKNRSRTGKDAKSIHKADYVKTDLYNALRRENNKHVPIFPTQVPADKNREYQLNPGYFVSTESAEEAYDTIFKGYIEDEFAKMQEAHEDIQNALSESKEDVDAALYLLQDGYHFNGTLFDENGLYTGSAFKLALFKGLNEVPTIRKIIDNIRKQEIGGPNFQDAGLNGTIKDYVVKQLNRVYGEQKEYLKKYNIEYTQDKNEDAFNSISSDLKVHYKNKYPADTKTSVINNAIVRDYANNSIISKIEYAKLFTGVLQYYGSNSKYIKRVPGTYVDGRPLALGLDENDISFKVLVFQTENISAWDIANPDINTQTPLTKENSGLTEAVKDYYRDIDRTDGQGWISPSRWEFIMRRAGKLNRDNIVVIDKLKKQWAAVNEGENIKTEDQLTTAEVKLLSAQPIKGVYFKNDLLSGPVYLKYSQAVLIPSVAANQPKMKQLMDFMVKNDIDEAVADTGVKVGGLKANKLFDEKGILNSIPKNRVLTLDNRYWRLQQDLPTKTIKDNKIGTQIQKIIVSELRVMGDVKVHPNYTASQLADAIDASLADLSNEGIRSFLKSYNIDEDTHFIRNLSEFYKPLLSEIKAEGVAFANVKEALEAELPLITVPHIKDKITSTFLAGMKRAATNLLSSGGGFIQISDHLIGLNTIRKRGIKMLVDDFSRLQPPRLDTKNKTILPGQVFIPHSIVAELVPNYMELSTKELRETLPVEVMRMIGYRIPTQSRASTDLFEVVGILPPEMGDSIIAYGEITAKTGSDFDIDKVYFMIPEMETYEEKTFSEPTTEVREITTEEQVDIEGIEGYEKPELNLPFMSMTELMSQEDKVAAKIIQDELKEDAKDLEMLIKCIWG